MSNCAYCAQQLGTESTLSPDIHLAACPFCFNVSSVDWDNGAASMKTLADIPPMNELAPEGSVMEGVLKTVAEAITHLPVLPEVPQRIISMVHDPLTSMDDLANVINDDAGLALRVLKISNSAYYAPTAEIADLKLACARLGLKVIAQIAHAEANAGIYRSASDTLREQTQQLWRHGVVTAFCADQVAQAASLSDTSTPFLAGLIHDIGKLVLMDTLFNKYSGRLGRLEEEPRLLQNVLSRFSPWIGAQVVRYWKMPNEILCSTFFCAKPDLVTESVWKPVTHVIALASGLAASLGFDLGRTEPDESVDFRENPSAIALNLSPERLRELYQTLAESAESYSDVFNLS